jgi:hypothetical protein
VSAHVRSSHSGPLGIRDSVDWKGLDVTGEDKLVDGWWTVSKSPFWTTSFGPARSVGQLAQLIESKERARPQID